jgi:putative mRNA 3-end processing factor
MDEIRRLLVSVERFPERTHMVGAYSLGKAQRLIALLREAGYDRPIPIHGALRKLCDYYVSRGIDLGELPDATVARGAKSAFAGEIVLAPPSAFAARWAQRFADPLIVFASGWMRIRARAKQRGVELPLILSDHCDWTELTQTIDEIDPGEVWITHGREEALARWCEMKGVPARPLNLVGYEDEAE